MLSSPLFSSARVLGTILSASLLVAYPAAAQSQRNTEGAKVTAEDAKPETKKVCRVEARTGSNMPRRVCRELVEGDGKGLDGLNQLREDRDHQQQTQRVGAGL